MSTVHTISGTPILLWCWVRGVQGKGSIFYITIGRDNYVSMLKKIAKKAREPEFDNFAADRLKLLKLKVPVGHGRISEIQNFTNDNVTLMNDMRKISTYWPENQVPPEDLIHVIVEAPDPAGESRQILST